VWLEASERRVWAERIFSSALSFIDPAPRARDAAAR